MKNVISITALLQEGGYQVVKLPAEMLGVLAVSIRTKGRETAELQSGIITIVGFMVTGDQTGARVIILEDKKAEVSNVS